MFKFMQVHTIWVLRMLLWIFIIFFSKISYFSGNFEDGQNEKKIKMKKHEYRRLGSSSATERKTSQTYNVDKGRGWQDRKKTTEFFFPLSFVFVFFLSFSALANTKTYCAAFAILVILTYLV